MTLVTNVNMQLTQFCKNGIIDNSVNMQLLSSISDGSHDTCDAVNIGFCPIAHTVYISILVLVIYGSLYC
jgi:hypothetical protein